MNLAAAADRIGALSDCRSIRGTRALGIVLALSSLAATAAASETVAVDLKPDLSLSVDAVKFDTVISADGGTVAFVSNQKDLVPGITNQEFRVFVRDLASNTTWLASRTSTGAIPITGTSWYPSLSADGRYVAFASTAALVPGAPSSSCVYLFNRVSGSVECVSLDAAGLPAPGFLPMRRQRMLSADGRYVAFYTNAPLDSTDVGTATDAYVRDRVLGRTTFVSTKVPGSTGAGNTFVYDIAPDGSRLLLRTLASDVAGTSGPGVYVAELATGTMTRVDVDASGNAVAGILQQRPMSMSADGRIVAFESSLPNPAFGDLDDRYDVYVADLTTHSIEVFGASAGRLVPGHTQGPVLSADGRYVAVETVKELVPWVTPFAGPPEYRAVMFDRVTRRYTVESISTGGAFSNRGIFDLAMSADARCFAYNSYADNLVAGDVPFTKHVFHRNRAGSASLGYGKPGTHGIPSLAADCAGDAWTAGSIGQFTLTATPPHALTLLFLSLDRGVESVSSGPLEGTVFVPADPFFVHVFATDGLGAARIPFVIPAEVPLAPEIYAQCAVADGNAARGVAATNSIWIGL